MNKKDLKILAIPFLAVGLVACSSNKEKPVETNTEKENVVIEEEVENVQPEVTEEEVTSEEVPVSETENTDNVTADEEENEVKETTQPPVVTDKVEQPKAPATTTVKVESANWSFVGLGDSHSAEFLNGSQAISVRFNDQLKSKVDSLETEQKVNVTYYKNESGQIILKTLEVTQ